MKELPYMLLSELVAKQYSDSAIQVLCPVYSDGGLWRALSINGSGA